MDQKVVGRILMLDPVEKKVTMTLKPSLLGSKLPILSDYAAATPGMKAHGVISNVNNDHGLFIAFYGGVSGLIGVQELGLVPRQTPSDVYQVGAGAATTALLYRSSHILCCCAYRSGRKPGSAVPFAIRRSVFVFSGQPLLCLLYLSLW